MKQIFRMRERLNQLNLESTKEEIWLNILVDIVSTVQHWLVRVEDENKQWSQAEVHELRSVIAASIEKLRAVREKVKVREITLFIDQQIARYQLFIQCLDEVESAPV
jgi:hypothetical protein